MSEPDVEILLDAEHRRYLPGDELRGTCRVLAPRGVEVKAIELSVMWRTEGQGDEDMAVHYFQRVSSDEAPEIDLLERRCFSTLLPNSPLSYDGVIVKIRWCVRVRVFHSRGKEMVIDLPFRLGNVPAARAAEEFEVS